VNLFVNNINVTQEDGSLREGDGATKADLLEGEFIYLGRLSKIHR
jgi:hypothetical protein